METQFERTEVIDSESDHTSSSDIRDVQPKKQSTNDQKLEKSLSKRENLKNSTWNQQSESPELPCGIKTIPRTPTSTRKKRMKSEAMLERDKPQVDEDGDDGLPVVNLTPKKVRSIEEGSIVWCKWKSDYWPALVKRIYKRERRMTVVFADLPCDDRGKEYRFTVGSNRVVHFDNSERGRNLLLTGLKGSQELRDAIEKARDLMVKRGLGWLHISPTRFLNNPIENALVRMHMENEQKSGKRKLILEKSDIDMECKKQSIVDAEDVNTNQNQNIYEPNNNNSEVNNDDSNDGENDANESTSSSFDVQDSSEEADTFDVDERSQEEKAFSASIISLIKTPECLERLIQIRNGTIDSTRHHWYCDGTAVERHQMKYLKFNHIVSVNEFELILKYLRKEIEKLSSLSRFMLLNYTLHVWLPEALIYGVQKLLNVSKERAEASLITGKLPGTP